MAYRYQSFNKNKMFFSVKIMLIMCLLITCSNVWANEKPPALIKVTGTGFVDIVAYPSKKLSAKVLVKKMMVERNRFPLRMSMEELNSLADAMTDFYRKKGFKFNTVYLPPQKIKDGFIHFKTIEAILGDIQVIGKNIDKKAIKAVFESFLNKPLYQPDIDYAVLALKNQRGLDAVAYYSRGSNPGEIRLNVKVNQQHWDAYVQADNYGSESTGENRLTSSVNWYGPTARLDQLSLGIMAADGDSDTNLFGYLNYRTPLWNLDNQLSLNLSNNLFSIGQDFTNLELNGDARIAQLRFDHQLNRTWFGEQALAVVMAYKTTDYDSAFNDPTLERDENSESLALEWNFNNQNQSGRFHQQWNVSATGGRYEIDGFTPEKQDFSKINAFANFRQYFGSGESRWSNLISLSVRGQYSDVALPSFEKLLLTGAYGVRSYQPGFFAGERGGFVSIDWYFTRLLQINSPGNANNNISIIPLLFVDVAHGEKLSVDGTVFDRATISGAGLGLEISMGQHWSARLFSSKEISQKTDSGLQLESMDFFLQINYRTQ